MTFRKAIQFKISCSWQTTVSLNLLLWEDLLIWSYWIIVKLYVESHTVLLRQLRPYILIYMHGYLGGISLGRSNNNSLTGGIHSTLRWVVSNISQGSILGHLLFGYYLGTFPRQPLLASLTFSKMKILQTWRKSCQ